MFVHSKVSRGLLLTFSLTSTNFALSSTGAESKFIGIYETETEHCDELKYLGAIEKVTINSVAYDDIPGLEVTLKGSHTTEVFKIRLGNGQSAFEYTAAENYIKSASRSWTTKVTTDSLNYQAQTDFGDKVTSEKYALILVEPLKVKFGYYFFDGIDRRDDRSIYAECTLKKIN